MLAAVTALLAVEISGIAILDDREVPAGLFVEQDVGDDGGCTSVNVEVHVVVAFEVVFGYGMAFEGLKVELGGIVVEELFEVVIAATFEEEADAGDESLTVVPIGTILVPLFETDFEVAVVLVVAGLIDVLGGKLLTEIFTTLELVRVELVAGFILELKTGSCSKAILLQLPL